MSEMTPKEAAASLRDTAELLENEYRREALMFAADTLDPPKPKAEWEARDNVARREGLGMAFCYDNYGTVADDTLASHRATVTMHALRADEEGIDVVALIESATDR